MSNQPGTPVELSEPLPQPRAPAAASESALRSAAPAPFGPPLAAAREALGLSQSEVASRLRLHPRQIAAIEAEQLTALPAAPFLRGFIRNYAKELRVDPAPLLTALDARLGPPPDLRAIGGGAVAIVRDAQRERLSRQFVVFGSVGALLALAAIGWFASQAPHAAPPLAAAVPATATPPAVALPGSDSPSASLPPPGARDAVQPAIAAAGPEVVAPATAPLLRISIGEQPSWIEVLQGDEGRVLHSGLIRARSEHELLAAPPLRLIVGNAASVRLEYRGEAVDLPPHTRSGVARLTIE